MFGTVLTVAVTLLQVYVFWRAGSVALPGRRLSPQWLVIMGVGFWGVFVAGRFSGHGNEGWLAGGLEAFGMVWMVVLFLTAVCLLVVDVGTGFGRFCPRHAPVWRGTALVFGAVLSVVAYVLGHMPPAVERYDVRIPGLPAPLEGRTMVALSDLHLGATLNGQWLAARVRQVVAERPDLVVLLGDMVEGHGAMDGDVAAILRGLSPPLGLWGVLGNHESHGQASGNSSLLADAGVRVLRNSWAEIQPGFILAGVDDLSAGEQNWRVAANLAATLQGRPVGATVLLSHAPWGAGVAAAQGVSLMLCGHTHGGQIWPFSYLVGLRYPLLDGRYEIGGATVIVCRGTGTWGPRMRLWSRGSILHVTLRRA